MSTRLRILNLGAGVQSTAVYLLALDGEIETFDCAIFADTQEEPQAVYDHLAWLKSLGGPEIRVVSRGRLGDDLVSGTNSTNHRFASIPVFMQEPDAAGTSGLARRQCSAEYKIVPIEREIRRGVLGLKPRARIPKGTKIQQVFGISLDEQRRAVAIQKRTRKNAWAEEPSFPLIDRNWTRGRCIAYLKGRVPHETPRSACSFCPFHNDEEWQHIKTTDPAAWKRALEIDEAIRDPTSRRAKDRRLTAYLHRSGLPLADVDFNAKGAMFPGLTFECEGMCGI